MLKVAEVFGPTFQGEGSSMGRRSAFIRLGRCNLECSWCDTPYTWDWEGKNGTAYVPSKEMTDMDVESLLEQVEAMDVPLVVITGGEPMAQQRSLIPLVAELDQRGYDIEFETNGTYAPLDDIAAHVTQFNVSPKLSNSNQPKENRVKPDALRALVDTGRAEFKFVVTGPDDLEEIEEIIALADIQPSNVWIMGEGRSAKAVEDHAEAVVVDVLERGWNMTTRLHVLLWGDKRGV